MTYEDVILNLSETFPIKKKNVYLKDEGLIMANEKIRKRRCGVLLPISSLPSNYGIGTFGESAYEFVDFLKNAGQSYWQILPLGPTSYGDSPYQSFSTFAGNPYFIDLDVLVKKGFLNKKDLEKIDFGKDSENVDYAKMYENRFKILRKAFVNTGLSEKSGTGADATYIREFAKFKRENEDWVRDYALFMTLKNIHNGDSFNTWTSDQILRKEDELSRIEDEYNDEVIFYIWQQFEFDNQWRDLKKYANQNGIQIVGDIPIYVAFDSADTWANPKLFQLDEKNVPIAVAGCPPDAFSATGQLWGNPLYNWDYHKKTGYKWWIKRIEHCYKLYDIVRIGHFRGFDEYYSIPFGDPTAEFGHWEKGPGFDLFKTLMDVFGKDMPIIAEDLGFLTPSVIKLVKRCGFPGMKVLQFAFDSRDDSDYLPHNYTNNSVVYTGTHDNETTRGWFETCNPKDRAFAKKYLDIHTRKDVVWIFIRSAIASVADTCIIPMQDYLNLDDSARINTPSTLGGNWTWRMKKDYAKDNLSLKMFDMAKTYGRI